MGNVIQFPAQAKEVRIETRFDEHEDDFYMAAYLGPDFIGRIMRDGNVWHCEPRGTGHDNKATQTETAARQYLVDCWRLI